MKWYWKKTVLILLALSLLLVGCAKGNQTGDPINPDTSPNSSPSSSPGTNSPEPAKLDPMKMTLMYRGLDFPQANVEIMKQKVKEKFNVDLQIDLVDPNVYAEKLQLAFSGGVAPDIVWSSDYNFISQAISNKAFLPIDDLVKNDSTWSSLPKEMYTSGTFNGSIYSLPTMIRIPDSMYYRIDWMENLGMKVPTNPDELYELLKAFAHGDPDGNKKNDTFGFTMESDFNRTDTIWNMFLPTPPVSWEFGAMGLYVDDNDQVQSSLLLADDVKKALSWLNTAYKEKVLDQEWVLEKKSTAEDKFTGGQTGMWIKGTNFITPRYEKLRKTFPDADIDSMPNIKGPYGNNIQTITDFVNEYFLTNSCKDLERCQQVLGFTQGPEGWYILRMGEEGKTYQITDGKIQWLDPENEKFYNPGTILAGVHGLELAAPDPILERSFASIEGYRIMTDLRPVYQQSQVAMSKITDFSKMISETFTKIIIGQSDLAEYDKLIEQLNSLGFEDVIKDVNRIYQER